MENNETPKLEWMYKASTGKDSINREEYLVGRKVDKQFEQNDNIIENKVLPTSIVNRNGEIYDKKDQVDILRKQIEDPLMMIKQKEIEAKRKILENPVKLKKLHELLKKDTIAAAKSSRDKKLKKKKKKSERNDETSSSSGEEEEDLDKMLLNKYKALQKSTSDSKKDSTFVNKKYFALTKELDKIVKTKKSKHHHRRSSSNSPRRDMKRSKRDSDDNYSKRRKSSSPDPNSYSRETSKNYGPDRDKKSKHHDRRSSSNSPRREMKRSIRDCDDNYSKRRKSTSPDPNSYSRETKNYGLITADGEKIELKHKKDVKWYSKSELKGKPAASSSKDHHKRGDNVRSKLTEEEMKNKRKEMMQNASWREKDREETVMKYRKTQKEEEIVQRKDYDKNFLDRHLKKAHEQASSIETRIKSNLNNIQRSKGTMDLNFAKR